MFVLAALYIALAFGALASLAFMILRIGQLLSECPKNGPIIRAGAITIATGFAAIGAGGVVLIGAILPLLSNAPFAGFLGALGLATLCLGLGFINAVGTLRALMQDVDRQPIVT
jgi:hypothetical protein